MPGRRGPAPEPPRLKLIKGRGEGRDSGGRPVEAATVGWVRLPPDKPDWLPAAASAEWDRVVPELQRLQLLKPPDRAALAAYCLTWQRLVDAQAQLADGELTTAGSMGQLVEHPAVKTFQAASRELRAWCHEFGLTPSAENGLSPAKPDDDGDENNPFAGRAAG